MLFVGWAPSLLLAYYSYSVFSPALEAKFMADAQSLVGSISQHVENELNRAGETMDYYRTLPVTASVLQPPVPVAPAVPNTVPSSLNAGRHQRGAQFPPLAPPPVAATVEPDRRLVPLYAEAYARYRALYPLSHGGRGT